MYYLFLTKSDDLNHYKSELERVRENIQRGKTPVYNELRSAKTNLIETLPYNTMAGGMLIIGAAAIEWLNIKEPFSIALVMVINNFCCVVANYAFVWIKHQLRVALCHRMGVQPDDTWIAAMESLEYQSV